MERRQGEPPNQLEVSQWTLPGGPGGEVTEGGLVSCQLLACKQSERRVFCMKEFYDEWFESALFVLRSQMLQLHDGLLATAL